MYCTKHVLKLRGLTGGRRRPRYSWFCKHCPYTLTVVRAAVREAVRGNSHRIRKKHLRINKLGHPYYALAV